MKVLETIAMQIRIYQKDTIPYDFLLRPDRVKLLQDHFSFQKHEIPIPVFEQDAPRILNLLSGEIKLNNKNILIDQLVFEDRKVIIRIKGTSDDLNSLFLELSSFLGNILDGHLIDDSKIILKTDQTECVVQIDVDFMSVFSSKFRRYLKKNIPPKMSHKVEMMIPRRLSVELSFEQPIQYRSYNLTISPKSFAIEPRATTRLEDKIFFTASPCPSDVHIELIKEFEEAFKG